MTTRRNMESSPLLAPSSNHGGSPHRKVTEKRPAKKRCFPWKLHRMLQDSNREHILSWSPDGHSFKIHNPSLFVKEVMPFYFNQTQYRSFQRLLNLYNFEPIVCGPMKGGYQHPSFTRDHEEHCQIMTIRPRNSAHTTCRRDEIPPSPVVDKFLAQRQEVKDGGIGRTSREGSTTLDIGLGLSHHSTLLLPNSRHSLHELPSSECAIDDDSLVLQPLNGDLEPRHFPPRFRVRCRQVSPRPSSVHRPHTSSVLVHETNRDIENNACGTTCIVSPFRDPTDAGKPFVSTETWPQEHFPVWADGMDMSSRDPLLAARSIRFL